MEYLPTFVGTCKSILLKSFQVFLRSLRRITDYFPKNPHVRYGRLVPAATDTNYLPKNPPLAADLRINNSLDPMTCLARAEKQRKTCLVSLNFVPVTLAHRPFLFIFQYQRPNPLFYKYCIFITVAIFTLNLNCYRNVLYIKFNFRGINFF